MAKSLTLVWNRIILHKRDMNDKSVGKGEALLKPMHSTF